jgi:membrane protease YdiL (CAAX protease family)
MEETRCQHRWCANLVTSLLFCGLHGLTRGGIVGLSVFVPSLFYGWLYQRTRNLPLLVFAHTISNLFFITFLTKPLSRLLHPDI